MVVSRIPSFVEDLEICCYQVTELLRTCCCFIHAFLVRSTCNLVSPWDLTILVILQVNRSTVLPWCLLSESFESESKEMYACAGISASSRFSVRSSCHGGRSLSCFQLLPCVTLMVVPRYFVNVLDSIVLFRWQSFSTPKNGMTHSLATGRTCYTLP